MRNTIFQKDLRKRFGQIPERVRMPPWTADQKTTKGFTTVPFRQMLYPTSAPNGNGPACLVNRHIHNLSLGYADMCMR